MDSNNEDIYLSLERLRRQYEICIQVYDKAALLDLSHILRLWVDMKEEVQKFYPSPLFRSYVLGGKLKKQLGRNEHVLTALPGGVWTKAGNGEISSFAGRDHSKLKFTISNKMKFIDGGLNITRFSMVYHISNKSESKILDEGIIEKRSTFLEWMQSESIRLNLNIGDAVTRSIIPREILIKRVANILGGSHPTGNTDSNNKFDPYIRALMDYNLGGLPLPYFVLLKTAKDILEHIR